ncbi:tyrosine-type recombinase/integrase [Halomonas sp. FME1]|uniref:Tyrosine-type recombinase/integrase n=1 Tax=Halomonas casei TaxID=2742613 RepID=A0ABR9F317_9GAMM|nr:tyrosine-type recombinase/integrase [Halomonas casei]MBE0400519.1 tyrosine-type recombinase/integrase [Halomonas casei]
MAKKYERDYLYQKAGESTWYVKLTIPADVRAALGNRRTLTRTTGTSNRAQARDVSYPILAEWKRLIAEARSSKKLVADKWRELQADEGKTLIQKRVDAAQRFYTPRPVQTEQPDTREFLDSLYDLHTDLIDDGRPDLAQMVKEYSFKLIENKPRTQGEGIDLHNKYLQIIEEVGIAATAEKYSLSETEVEEARQITRRPDIYKPRSPISKAMIAQWSQHLDTQVEKQKTRDSHVSRVQRLSDWLSAEGVELTFDTVHTFLGSVSSTRKTRSNYLWSGRSFWEWAIKYSPPFREQFGASPSPFEGHKLPRTGKDAGESYTPFTVGEVENLHKAAVEKGDTDLANLIAVGAYTGCRIEEVGRISKDNVIFTGHTPTSIKIEDAKTKAGIREIPLHSEIAPLFKRLLSCSIDGFLFKGGNNKYQNRLDYMSKRFGRLKTALGYSRLHVYHSIRKTAVTQMQHKGAPALVIPAIVGHETGSITFDVYSAGASMEQKREAIELLHYNFTHPG